MTKASIMTSRIWYLRCCGTYTVDLTYSVRVSCWFLVAADSVCDGPNLTVSVTTQICCAVGRKKNIHGRFDMGRMFSNKREDKEGFSPLTAQEDHYTDDEYEDESDVETRR